MRKAMKKVVSVAAVTVMMAMCFTGCAKKTECEGCNETKKCNKYEVTMEGDTETGWLCKDCADEMESMVDLINSMQPGTASMKKK